MEETSLLIAGSQTGDKKAREVLIEKNLGLVHTIVRRFYGRGHEAEDLFQIGCIGLIKAIDKFDLSLGLCFSTYAVPMITGEIKRFLRDDGPIKVSRTIRENNRKILQAKEAFIQKENREPTLKEIAKACGLTTEEAVLALGAGFPVESLYAPVAPAAGDETSNMFLVDRVVLMKQGGIGNVVGENGNDSEKEKLLDHMLLTRLLETLSDSERELLRLRYFENKTQREVAEIMGTGQVQVSRREKKILLKLREYIH